MHLLRPWGEGRGAPQGFLRKRPQPPGEPAVVEVRPPTMICLEYCLEAQSPRPGLERVQRRVQLAQDSHAKSITYRSGTSARRARGTYLGKYTHLLPHTCLNLYSRTYMLSGQVGCSPCPFGGRGRMLRSTGVGGSCGLKSCGLTSGLSSRLPNSGQGRVQYNTTPHCC